MRSDLGGAGVMFSIDTETGFYKVVLIEESPGAFADHADGGVAGFDARAEQVHGRDSGQQ